MPWVSVKQTVVGWISQQGRGFGIHGRGRVWKLDLDCGHHVYKPYSSMAIPAGRLVECTTCTLEHNKPMAYVVCESHARRRPNGDRLVVWNVRANNGAATLVATFDSEEEARKFARRESSDAL